MNFLNVFVMGLWLYFICSISLHDNNKYIPLTNVNNVDNVVFLKNIIMIKIQKFNYSNDFRKINNNVFYCIIMT
jgi:hypothetical protein